MLKKGKNLLNTQKSTQNQSRAEPEAESQVMEDDQQRLQKMKRRDFGEICERNEVLRMVYKAVRDI